MFFLQCGLLPDVRHHRTLLCLSGPLTICTIHHARPGLHTSVCMHAGRVQVSLIAEAVLWKRGILVMPPIVNKLVQAMQVSPAAVYCSLPCAHACSPWHLLPSCIPCLSYSQSFYTT